MSLSTLFKSYWYDGRMIMNGSTQWSAIQSKAEFHFQCDSNLRLHDLSFMFNSLSTLLLSTFFGVLHPFQHYYYQLSLVFYVPFNITIINFLWCFMSLSILLLSTFFDVLCPFQYYYYQRSLMFYVPFNIIIINFLWCFMSLSTLLLSTFFGVLRPFQYYYYQRSLMFYVPFNIIIINFLWCFMSLSTLLKSYWYDGRMIMNGSTQWSAIQSKAEFHFQCDSNSRLSDLSFVFYIPFNIIIINFLWCFTSLSTLLLSIFFGVLHPFQHYYYQLSLVFYVPFNIIIINFLWCFMSLSTLLLSTFFGVLHPFQHYYYQHSLVFYVPFNIIIINFLWCFMSLSTLLKSYWYDGRMIMNGSTQCSAIQSKAEFHFQCDSNSRLQYLSFMFYIPFNIIIINFLWCFTSLSTLSLSTFFGVLHPFQHYYYQPSLVF